MESLKTILEKLVESQQELHILVAICVAVCLILIMLGYIAGKISLKRRLQFAEVKQRTRQAEIELEKQTVENAVELQRLKAEDKAAQHKRDLIDREREEAFRLKLAQRLAGLRPAIEQCLGTWNEFVNTVMDRRIKEREVCRQKHVYYFVEKMKEKGYNPWQDEFTVTDDERERIEAMVDAECPLPEFTLPEPLNSLADSVCGPVTGKSDASAIETT